MTTSTVRRIVCNAHQRDARRAKVHSGMTSASSYQFLQKYLEHRYADTVVLSMRQIEDLLGFALPAQARTDPAWWTSAEGALAPQNEAWVSAHRTAKPNLPAGNVVFERIAS
jgi:hypothetical protein